MANQYGFSLAEVYKDAEQIKGARMQNELNQMKLEDYEAQKQNNALLAPIRQKAVSGDKNAQKTLMALDPKSGPEFIKAVQSAKKGDLELMQSSIDQMGSMASSILETYENRSPEDAMRMYKDWYRSVDPEARKQMPTTNIKGWLTDTLTKATAMDQFLSEHKVMNYGDKQLLTKGNRIIDQTDKPKSAADMKAMGVQDKDIRTAARLINQTYGGKFQMMPDGNVQFTGLSDESNRKAMSALVRTVEIMREQNVDSATASKMAMEEMGTQFPNPVKQGSKTRQSTSRYSFDPATGSVAEL